MINSEQPYPLKHITIEISLECNGGCKMCPQSLIDNLRPARIDYGRVIELLEELKDWPDLEYIEFHNYNEPLLYPNYFFSFASRARDILGPNKIGIVTNGSTMTENLAERILWELEPHHVWFSLDAFNLKTYQKIRPGLDLIRVLNGMHSFWKIAVERKFPVGILFVVMEENIKEVEVFKQYWTEKGNYQIYFQWCDGRGFPIKERSYSKSDDEACDYVLENVIILTNLDVVPCCIDWQGKLAMGNLKDRIFEDIWNGLLFNSFRFAQINKQKSVLPICCDCQTALIHEHNRFETNH